MDAIEYAAGVTAESQAFFETAYSYYVAIGYGFDAAVQKAIADEQALIERLRKARKGKEA